MFRQVAVRLVDAVRGGPVTSMLVVALVSAAVAATAIAATSTSSGGPITAVKVVRSTGSQSITSENYVDVPGASTTITIPSGQRALIVARFQAQSYCVPSVNAACIGNVRILIGGVEGAPGGPATFHDVRIGEPARQGVHGIERSRSGYGGLPAGTYEVKVQAQAALAFGSSFYIENFHLTVETSRTS